MDTNDNDNYYNSASLKINSNQYVKIVKAWRSAYEQWQHACIQYYASTLSVYYAEQNALSRTIEQQRDRHRLNNNAVVYLIVHKLKKSTLNRRLIAEVIDLFFEIIIKAIMFTILSLFIGEGGFQTLLNDIARFSEVTESMNFILSLSSPQMIPLSWELMLIQSMFFIIAIVYETLFIWKYGCTVGKYMCSLRVFACDQYDFQASPGEINLRPWPPQKLSIVNALRRASIKQSMGILSVPLLIYSYRHDDGRSWADIRAKSVVVHFTKL
ncbi:hypothetical protein GJ496_010744 [Pomphorhynchus laevis]|nr:hypothetical protein GJ496_010744 [Pomphorhynchus laevis]